MYDTYYLKKRRVKRSKREIRPSIAKQHVQAPNNRTAPESKKGKKKYTLMNINDIIRPLQLMTPREMELDLPQITSRSGRRLTPA
jgi:hypothetical protein